MASPLPAIAHKLPARAALRRAVQEPRHATPALKPDAGMLTAQYTFELAAFTAVLAIATVGSVITSICLQWRANRRDDRLRRDAAETSEKIRQEQYAVSERLRKEERDYNAAALEGAREAAKEQMISILVDFERTMNVLIAMPHHAVSSMAATTRLLFARSLAADMVDAIPQAVRPKIYDIVIGAQSAINATLEQQAMRDREARKYLEDEAAAKAFDALLAKQQQITRERPGVEERAELVRLQGSPEAERAKSFKDGAAKRGKFLDGIYPTIQRNAEKCKDRLVYARGLLGDDSGPLPGLELSAQEDQ